MRNPLAWITRPPRPAPEALEPLCVCDYDPFWCYHAIEARKAAARERGFDENMAALGGPFVDRYLSSLVTDAPAANARLDNAR